MPENPYRHAFADVMGVRTHYLEAGTGPCVVLVHSGEYSASAELSWRYNIAALARHFRVLAPDGPGFGDTDKVYSFSDRTGFRIRHLVEFCRLMGVPSAHFVGNSFSGGLLLAAASDSESQLPVEKLIVISGGGESSKDPSHRDVLATYDGSPEHMRKILQVLFYDEKWWSDERVAERQESALKPGAWEACSASRLRRPGDDRVSLPPNGDPGAVKVPTLIVAGAQDLLKGPDYGPNLQSQIPGSQLHIFEESRHEAHIEHADEFNELASSFLLG